MCRLCSLYTRRAFHKSQIKSERWYTALYKSALYSVQTVWSLMSLSLTRPRRRGALLGALVVDTPVTTLSNPPPACRAGPVALAASVLSTRCRHSYQSSIVQHPRCTNPQKLEAGKLRYLSTVRATSSSSPMVEPPALLPQPPPPHLPHLRQGAPQASPGANALLRARGGASGP